MHLILVSELRIALQISPTRVQEREAACLSFVMMAFRDERLASTVVISGYAIHLLHLGLVWHVGIHKTQWFSLGEPLMRIITTTQHRRMNK